jgi:hypothetical protein
MIDVARRPQPALAAPMSLRSLPRRQASGLRPSTRRPGGLTESEAARRLRNVGPNASVPPQRSHRSSRFCELHPQSGAAVVVRRRIGVCRWHPCAGRAIVAVVAVNGVFARSGVPCRADRRQPDAAGGGARTRPARRHRACGRCGPVPGDVVRLAAGDVACGPRALSSDNRPRPVGRHRRIGAGRADAGARRAEAESGGRRSRQPGAAGASSTGSPRPWCTQPVRRARWAAWRRWSKAWSGGRRCSSRRRRAVTADGRLPCWRCDAHVAAVSTNVEFAALTFATG